MPVDTPRRAGGRPLPPRAAADPLGTTPAPATPPPPRPPSSRRTPPSTSSRRASSRGGAQPPRADGGRAAPAARGQGDRAVGDRPGGRRAARAAATSTTPRYAQRFAEDRRRLDAWGAERIERRLRAPGSSPSTIAAALAEQDPERSSRRRSRCCERRFPVARRRPATATGRSACSSAGATTLELAHDALRATRAARTSRTERRDRARRTVSGPRGRRSLRRPRAVL